MANRGLLGAVVLALVAGVAAPDPEITEGDVTQLKTMINKDIHFSICGGKTGTGKIKDVQRKSKTQVEITVDFAMTSEPKNLASGAKLTITKAIDQGTKLFKVLIEPVLAVTNRLAGCKTDDDQIWGPILKLAGRAAQ